MIRATSFADGSVRFRTRFVRTKKFEAEEKAGRFLYPTWTTPAPRRWENIPGYPSLGQAGVTAVVKDGRLHAFDEVGLPYGLDPASLETTGPLNPDADAPAKGPSDYKAHTKTDGESGDWVLIGTRGQVKQDLHVLVKDRAGRHKAQVVLPSPRGEAYFHDFFWASPYAVFLLQPALLSPLPMVLGFRSYTDSLRWTPSAGGLLVVVDTSGERAPMTLEVPAVWMWHALNACGGDRILADFVGYDARIISSGPCGLPHDHAGTPRPAKAPGCCGASPSIWGQEGRDGDHRHGPFQSFPCPIPVGSDGSIAMAIAMGDITHDWYQTGLARIDARAARELISFGADYYVGEPIFAPDPARRRSRRDGGSRLDLAEVLDGKWEGFLASSMRPSGGGPVARLNSGPICP
jgi:all-trans-8'-apo-beta-carotenal 15,15'-oxygenase